MSPDKIIFHPHMDRLVQTSWGTGLTREKANEIIEKFLYVTKK